MTEDWRHWDIDERGDTTRFAAYRHTLRLWINSTGSVVGDV